MCISIRRGPGEPASPEAVLNSVPIVQNGAVRVLRVALSPIPLSVPSAAAHTHTGHVEVHACMRGERERESYICVPT